MNVAANVDKSNPFEFGNYLQSLKASGLKMVEISNQTNVNRNEVRHYIKIAEWPDEVEKFCADNNVPNTPILKAARSTQISHDSNKLIEYFKNHINNKKSKKVAMPTKKNESSNVHVINNNHYQSKIDDLVEIIEQQKEQINNLKSEFDNIKNNSNSESIKDLIKSAIREKTLYIVKNLLNIEYIKLLPLALLAFAYSLFLIFQGKSSYETMNIPFHDYLAIGAVLTLSAIKVWTSFVQSKSLIGIMIAIIAFEGFVLFKAKEVSDGKNIEAMKIEVESRKAFLSSEIDRLTNKIERNRQVIISHNQETNDYIKSLKSRAADLRSKNILNLVGSKERVGALDVERELKKYRQDQAQKLNYMNENFNIDKDQSLLSKYKAELKEKKIITLDKDNSIEWSFKALIIAIIALNILVFHNIGHVLRNGFRVDSSGCIILK